MEKALSRRVAAAAISLAAAAFLISCAAARRAANGIDLRVMSYNIQAGGGNLDSIVGAIRDLSPDIVGLQEVDVHWSARSQFADQATELGARLGLHVRFAPIYRTADADPSRPSRQFGVALLSRYPVIEWRNDSLTRLSTQVANAAPVPMPGMLEAILNVDGRRLRVFSTHLDYRADPRVRAQQVTETLRYIGGWDGPTILFGDLNAPPDAEELSPLLGNLRDAWTAAAGAGFTYPSGNPVKRIDYVLVSSHFVVRGVSVGSTLASDHRPVIAELSLRRESRP